MNLDDLWRILVRRGWIPVALAVLGGLAGYLFARLQSPVYDAESRVSIVAARPADLGQTQAINGLLRSFAAEAVTMDMAQTVAASLGRDDPGTLKGWASAVADEGTREIRVRYRSSDPAEAERVADTWAKAFVAGREQANLELDQRERVFASQRDSTTHRQSWPRPKLTAALGAAAGVTLGIVLILLLEYGASATVRHGDDLGALGLPAALGAVGATIAPRPRIGRAMQRTMISRTVSLALPVVGFALIGALVAVALASAQTDTYRARTRIAVMPARTSDWGQTQAIREIMRGYSEDISTRRMASEVARRLELDLPEDKVLQGLVVAPNEDTYEIWLDYKSPDPSVAESVSAAWAAAFAEERSLANQDLDRVDRIYVRVRDHVPPENVKPAPAFALLAGAVIGALCGAAAATATHSRSRRHTVGGPDWTPLGRIPASTPGGAG